MFVKLWNRRINHLLLKNLFIIYIDFDKLLERRNNYHSKVKKKTIINSKSQIYLYVYSQDGLRLQLAFSVTMVTS